MVGLTSIWSQLMQDRQKWKNVCASKINSIVTSRVELENDQSSPGAAEPGGLGGLEPPQLYQLYAVEFLLSVMFTLSAPSTFNSLRRPCSRKARDRADPSRRQDQQPLLCTTCKQLFKSQTGGKRHNCNRGQNRPDPQERAMAGIKCDRCSRLFTRESDKKRHKCHQSI